MLVAKENIQGELGEQNSSVSPQVPLQGPKYTLHFPNTLWSKSVRKSWVYFNVSLEKSEAPPATDGLPQNWKGFKNLSSLSPVIPSLFLQIDGWLLFEHKVTGKSPSLGSSSNAGKCFLVLRMSSWNRHGLATVFTRKSHSLDWLLVKWKPISKKTLSCPSSHCPHSFIHSSDAHWEPALWCAVTTVKKAALCSAVQHFLWETGSAWTISIEVRNWEKDPSF